MFSTTAGHTFADSESNVAMNESEAIDASKSTVRILGPKMHCKKQINNERREDYGLEAFDHLTSAGALLSS